MEGQELTEEQHKFLKECEEEFKDRYTEKDSEFMKMKNVNMKTPPIVDFWYSRERRSHGRFSHNQNWHRKRNYPSRHSA